MTQISLDLKPRPPFRLDLTVWTLRRRPDNAMDRWDGQTYRRVLLLPTGPVEVAVAQVEPLETPRLRVSVGGQPVSTLVKDAVTSSLERLLGLNIDMGEFYRFAEGQGQLGQLVRRFRGMKPPRFATVFESVINGSASQQVSRVVAILVLNRYATFHRTLKRWRSYGGLIYFHLLLDRLAEAGFLRETTPQVADRPRRPHK